SIELVRFPLVLPARLKYWRVVRLCHFAYLDESDTPANGSWGCRKNGLPPLWVEGHLLWYTIIANDFHATQGTRWTRRVGATALTDLGLPSMECLKRGALELGIHLDPVQLDQFARLQVELLDWNRRFNLTAITEPSEVQIKHFVDSLTVI